MLAFWLILAPFAAHADLYRWIDPESGSVKLSSMPPSDPRIQAEVVRYNAPPPPKPAAPAPPAATPAVPARATLPELEARWRSLLSQLTGLKQPDFDRGAEGLRQHMETYDAVRAELDRQDPAGAARRRAAEQTTLIERLRQGLLSR
jgi:hypothetical protein